MKIMIYWNILKYTEIYFQLDEMISVYVHVDCIIQFSKALGILVNFKL